MQAKVNWQEGLSFAGTADSGFNIQMDAKQEVGGKGKGFIPMELMAMSLAGCTAMDVISILQKKQQDITAFEVRVEADRTEEHPRVFTHATIDYIITGHGVDQKAVVRAIELTAERYCPAQAMLKQVFPIELRYKIIEEKYGENELLVEGIYNPAVS